MGKLPDHIRVRNKEWRKNNKDRYKEHCKKSNEKHAARIRLDRQSENRLYLCKYLSNNPCVDCKEKDIRCLQFDHVRGVKKKDISKLLNEGYKLKYLKEEIEKCEVRCANCHAKRTSKVQNWYKHIYCEQNNTKDG